MLAKMIKTTHLCLFVGAAGTDMAGSQCATTHRTARTTRGPSTLVRLTIWPTVITGTTTTCHVASWFTRTSSGSMACATTPATMVASTVTSALIATATSGGLLLRAATTCAPRSLAGGTLAAHPGYGAHTMVFAWELRTACLLAFIPSVR